MAKIFRTALFIISVLYLSSCKDEYTICNLSKNVNFIAGFYNRVAGADVSVQVPYLTVSLLNSSFPIYSQAQNISTFSLPLNSLVDSSRYVITISNSTSDTLTIVYTSQSTNLSAECGSVVYNTITKLYSTAHTIDSVKISKPFINTEQVQNAKIYF